MKYSRMIFDKLAKSRKTILLLGPRQTGKSTLLGQMEFDLKINLALQSEYLRYLRDPSILEHQVAAKDGKIKRVLIDEVQRIPSILNTVQALIDETGTQFYLTGSSARKLRRGQANLLPGRIHQYWLGPLTYRELGDDFDLNRALSKGTMPGIWSEDEDDAVKTLEAYASTYIKEEIQAEALTKNLEGFSRYLFSVASWSGRQVDHSKLSVEAGIERTTASRYFEILEDTLLIATLEPFSLKSRLGGLRRIVKHPKFYFFDTGILNAMLQNFHVDPQRKGLLFEHLMISQILSMAKGLDVLSKMRLSTYRTDAGAEVDLIVEIRDQLYAIELKCSKNVGRSDLRGLASFSEYFGKTSIKKRILTLDPVARRMEGVDILHWRDGIDELFDLS